VTAASGRDVLIVDDDADTAEAIQIVLDGAGYHTRVAPDAQDAFRQVGEQRPDLILLDIMMPSGTEGFHFVWDLRRDPDPARGNIPIIVLTAIHRTTRLRFYPDQGDGTYAPGEFLPVQGFLDKPVASEMLLAEVDRVLKQAEAASG